MVRKMGLFLRWLERCIRDSLAIIKYLKAFLTIIMERLILNYQKVSLSLRVLLTRTGKKLLARCIQMITLIVFCMKVIFRMRNIMERESYSLHTDTRLKETLIKVV